MKLAFHDADTDTDVLADIHIEDRRENGGVSARILARKYTVGVVKSGLDYYRRKSSVA